MKEKVNRKNTSNASNTWNMAFMFPDEIVKARKRIGLVILPVAPLEWHGPHLAMGCDNLLAHAFARRLAEELKCPYFPPLFVGTEREREPDQVESLGFKRGQFIEGMDFPKNSITSAYHREETFALVVRDTLNIFFDRMKFSRVLIVNGHGACNQGNVLTRLCNEFNAGRTSPRVMWVYPFPKGTIAHAGAEESSLLESEWPGTVDVSRLPAKGKLKNIDHAIIDGETFDLNPTEDHTVRERQDPRLHTDPAWGRTKMEEGVREVVAEVRQRLK